MTRTAVFRLVVVRQGDMSGKFPDWVTDQTLPAADCAVRPLLLLSGVLRARSVDTEQPGDGPVLHGETDGLEHRPPGHRRGRAQGVAQLEQVGADEESGVHGV